MYYGMMYLHCHAICSVHSKDIPVVFVPGFKVNKTLYYKIEVCYAPVLLFSHFEMQRTSTRFIFPDRYTFNWRFWGRLRRVHGSDLLKRNFILNRKA